jgi:BMFP domain-containing protein YqiC
MFSSKTAQDMAKQFVDSLPPTLKSIGEEFENQLKDYLQKGFSKMNLVTREEFDIQTRVLAKTRDKLEAMEEALRKIESNLPSK